MELAFKYRLVRTTKSFRSDFGRGFLDWPSDWPRMDTIAPRFSSHLDRLDRNWRTDPFWRDLYPRWAEPIFKEGIDIKAKVINDSQRFIVDVDAYQFRPEEIQVKTIDDTLLIEGRHEDVRDRDNFTKMYFVRKYQLPADVNPQDVTSSIDSSGRLTVEAVKHVKALPSRERVVPVEGPSKRGESRASDVYSHSSRSRNDSGNYSPRGHPPTQGRSHSSSSFYHRSSTRTTTNPPDSVQDREYGRRKDYPLKDERKEREYRSESRNEYRSESRQGETSQQRYRVDSPGSAYSQQAGGQHPQQNGKAEPPPPPRSDSRSESVRSVQILRKSFS
ncbi:unnamed protein product [Enterobius vermicularis]|uniref:SHSP domain-containing protein n=1 Tax=Enterobius vermicularis TaxID=51028 RepID=A0A0N4VEY2_ENTVE|nr:unnamed protein product [Enterobius vermicularis]